jgi:hypothetical protein
MRHKLLNATACAVMVLAALAPLVSAHNQALAAGDADTNAILNGGGIELEAGTTEDGLSELPGAGHVDDDRYSTVPGAAGVYPAGPKGCSATALNTFPAGCPTEDRGAGPGVAPYGGVSGRYLGSAFVANAVGGSSESSLFPLATVPNPLNPTLGPATFTLLPGGLFASLTGPFCDLEVEGDGRHVDPMDETTVDAFVGATTATIPNGLWDDGGQGGACHTTGYNAAPDGATFTYNGGDNTPGCPAGEYARAEDAVGGDSVWIATSCDVSHPVISISPSLINCLENGIVLQRNWASLTQCFNSTYGCSLPQYLTGQPIPAPGPGFPPNPGQIPAIEGCTANALTGELACNVFFGFPPTEPQIQACITNIALDILLCQPPLTTSNCLPPPTTACGGDNGADVTLFGEGGGHNLPGDTEPLSPTGRPIYDDGVPFQGGSSSSGACALNVGQAFVSALTGVHVEVPRLQGLADGSFTPRSDGVAVNLALATTGWISTVTAQEEPEAETCSVDPGYDLFQTDSGTYLGLNDISTGLAIHFEGVSLGSYDFGSGSVSVGSTDTILHHSCASPTSPVSTLDFLKLHLRSVESIVGIGKLYITLQSERGVNSMDPPIGPPGVGTMLLSFDDDGSGGFADSHVVVSFDARKTDFTGPIVAFGTLHLNALHTTWARPPPPPTEGRLGERHEPAVQHAIKDANLGISGINYQLNGVDTTQDFRIGYLLSTQPVFPEAYVGIHAVHTVLGPTYVMSADTPTWSCVDSNGATVHEGSTLPTPYLKCTPPVPTSGANACRNIGTQGYHGSTGLGGSIQVTATCQTGGVSNSQTLAGPVDGVALSNPDGVSALDHLDCTVTDASTPTADWDVRCLVNVARA